MSTEIDKEDKLVFVPLNVKMQDIQYGIKLSNTQYPFLGFGRNRFSRNQFSAINLSASFPTG